MELRAVLNSEREFPSVSKESTARQSTEKIRNRKTPYILNVNDTATALVIAQLPIAEKENERITAHPDQTATYEKQMDSYDVFKTIEKNRSRMEYRTMQICHNTDLITLENSLHYVLDDLTLIEKYAFRGIAHL